MTKGIRPWDCRVAVELVRIGEVNGSVHRFGDRYLRRIYTDHELSTCRSVPGGDAPESEDGAGLAARFAAKAATLKVLESSGVRPDLRSIEVLHHPEGAYGVKLTGDLAAAAAAVGIGRISVSLSNGGGTASAVVTAICDEQPSSTRRSRPGRPESGVSPGALDAEIRSVLNEHGRLVDDAETLAEDADLTRSGLTSHASVNVLLALEEALQVTFPAPLAQQSTFRSIASIRQAVTTLTVHSG
jgi:phosphopantetheine--protein transferase-like protein